MNEKKLVESLIDDHRSDEEARDILIAISVIAKRLSQKLDAKLELDELLS